ncbi:phenoloxidase-activating factor 2-like [Zerene cesonia]|uniref:phenoloxidase-activating factor 2-like n=1 Tax=Zerene cesonia TaxID=33412 RepID=UPI0018E52305|nr:phenoloxidase-activating factor 2-like [Zerene cesonia]
MKVHFICFLMFCCYGYSEGINNSSTPALNGSPSITKAPLKLECMTEKQFRGRCVKPSQCRDTKDEDDLLNPLIPTAYRSPLVCEDSKVCCPKKLIIVESPVHEGCGWSYFEAHEDRLFSDYASFGEYPWIIAVLRKTSDPLVWWQNDYVAGGTLIHPSVVMTAAHKVVKLDPNEAKCRAGEWDISSTNEAREHQDRNVKKIILHEQLRLNEGYNNIALLILEQPFDLTNNPHIGIACLGSQMPPTGTTCIAAGWHMHFNSKSSTLAAALRRVQLPIFDKQTCQVEMNKFNRLRYWKIHDSVMCAGGMAGADTCTGDSGMPIICEVQSDSDYTRYAVYGIHGFRMQCGRKDRLPGINTDVAYEYDWIKTSMTREGLNATTFEYQIPE